MKPGEPGLGPLRLSLWLSPSFPTGSFAWSHGLEAAVQEGRVSSEAALCGWLEDLLLAGSPVNDAILMAASWHCAQKGQGPGDIAGLAEALCGSHERHQESLQQGAAFLQAIREWHGMEAVPDVPPQGLAWPVAFGVTAGTGGIELEPALAGFVGAQVSALVQAALRLMPLGQKAGVRILSSLEPTILALVRRAAVSTLDDLGSATWMSDIMAMRHEVCGSRIFRS